MFRNVFAQVRFAKIAGLKVPDALCGVSLLGVLEGSESSMRPVYVENVPDSTRTYFSVAYIDANLKTIIKPKSGTRELYDLDSDPEERRETSAERPKVLAEQLDRIRDYQRAHGLNPEAYGL